MKRIIIVIVIIAAIAAGWFFFTRYQSQQQALAAGDFQTAAAERGSLTATVGATGIVRANQTAALAWRTSGIVGEVFVEVGDEVTADTVLAELAATSLPQNVILAQAELTDARRQLEDLQSQTESAANEALRTISTAAQQLRDAQYRLDNYTIPSNQSDLSAIEAFELMQSRLEEARQAFEPYKYYSQNNDTRRDLKEALDEAQADYDAAVRRLEYEYAVQVAQSTLAQARGDYETYSAGPDPEDVAALEARIDAAQATIDLAHITAPFAGTVTEATVKKGDQVSTGSPAFRIDDLSRLLVDVQVSEVDINRIEVGQNVNLSFDAILDQEYHGVVTEVAFVGGANQGVVDFTVTVELTDIDDKVRPGMTAAVNIVVNELEDVLLAPNRAIRLQDGDRIVYVLRDGTPQAVPVTLGASSDTHSAVVDGDLQVGDPIILNPPASFSGNGPPPFVQR
ncbi:MAG TPA: efflux RND transporter periplasmic adaptor subunit [Anaerolineales bacterium]|nr:efflux RND transporter periplasmic adaptor subunit [Anaerolineales bacterium]